VVGIGAVAVWTYMTIIWVFSVLRKDASIVDIFWGPGFAFLACIYFVFTPEGAFLRRTLIVAIVVIWGLRLGLYIFFRNRGKGEDKRYQAFRSAAGERYWWYSYFQVFMLQGVLMLLISTPLLAAQINPLLQPITLSDSLGTVFWVIGFLFEAIGDWQLAIFKANPANKGKVIKSGLWRYTRHPNYFGEAVLWWGYFLIAVSVPGGLWTIYSPILMTLLLLRVSGVALLEQSLRKEKPEYQAYIEETSSFIPWPPKTPSTKP
jgi:steroid 5-alpha reductase family enzyme